MSMSVTDGEAEVQEAAEADDEDTKAEIADTRAFIQQLKDCATLQNCIDLAKTAEDPNRSVCDAMI